jgi:anti-sigma regulatory factor (Ser/Thr protein kinase)
VLERETQTRTEHQVMFYDEEVDLVRAVADFVAVGGSEAQVIFVATPEHLREFERVVDSPNVVTFDAQAMLDLFCTDGVIDTDAFDRSIGDLVRRAARHGKPLRVYGEMVALLWQRGLVTQAIELEQLWCELGDSVPFALLCAYPSTLVLDHADPEPVNLVCDPHRKVVTPIRPSADVAVRAFPATKASVRSARMFVRDFLEELDDNQTDKLLLLASELATNAVRHAATPFVVEILRQGVTICVSVRDRSKRGVAMGRPPVDAESGRGLSLVDTLSDAWGVRWTKHGKVVWGEVNADETYTSK